MFYSNGNYEAFIRPRKPKGVDEKSAHLIGGGIASLSAAGFLIRDGQMDPKKITIYEASDICGGCLDGIEDPKEGFLFRGEREMEDHYECLWDLMRSIPSLDVEGASVLEDYYQINKDYPNYSKCRTIHKRGKPFPTDGKMLLTPEGAGRADEALLHPPERAARQEVRRVRERGVLPEQLLGLLAVDVRHRAVARRAGDEALHEPLRPALRRDGGSQHHQVHPPQPVRLPGPAAGQVARGEGRQLRLRHEGHQRRLRHHAEAQGRQPDRVSSRAASTAGSTSPRTSSCSSPTAPRSRTPPGATTRPRPSGTGTSRRAASGRCGAISPRRTPPSATPTSSAPRPTRPAMCRRASGPSTTRFRPTSSGSASATRTGTTGGPITGGLVTVRDSNWMMTSTSSAIRTSGTRRRTS